MDNKNVATKVVLTNVRFSYAHVFEPSSINGSDPKYSVSLILPKKDKEQIRKVEAAIEAAKELLKAKNGGKLPKVIKLPLRDGDEEREDEAYEKSFFLNANCKTKPGLVDRNCNPILDQDEFYSGCYGRASITFYPFDTNGNRGIACGLNNLQKLKDGEPLGGRSTAESDFAGFDDDDDDDLD
ncbi:MAG: DUF2815 family protein [Tannerellaceae bacterium]